MPMKQPAPISVRPRKGSALEEVWEGEGRSNRALGEIIHGWAQSFKDMVQKSEESDDE